MTVPSIERPSVRGSVVDYGRRLYDRVVRTAEREMLVRAQNGPLLRPGDEIIFQLLPHKGRHRTITIEGYTLVEDFRETVRLELERQHQERRRAQAVLRAGWQSVISASVLQESPELRCGS